MDETKRRKQRRATRATDRERWSDPGRLEPAWDARAGFAARFIPAGVRVLDLGCGAMALERHLPVGCTYVPADLVARDARTLECELNAARYPEGDWDVIVLLGVLEYVFEPLALLRWLRAQDAPALLSYCPTELTGAADRAALGWVNDFSTAALTALIGQAGLAVTLSERVDAHQILLRVERPRGLAKRVQVISTTDYPNFGDRLGYHLVHEVLPSDCVVRHSHFNGIGPAEPPGTYDLIVLGLGNSLFPAMGNELLGHLAAARRCIGIFGTQYRTPERIVAFAPLMARLDRWYARSAEDASLFPAVASKTTHLGDWLIHAFPMAEPVDDRVLRIDAEIMHQDVPLDRTIQRIQRHRRVWSARLHPLLCALTSADEVAYVEQSDGERPSGKFRSMLLDVFGRDYPENAFWRVDRAAVAAYKRRVARAIATLRADLEGLLFED
jgi:hypothetical protein